MKISVSIIAALCLTLTVHAQKYITKNGNIKFYSETPVEKIEAHNNQVNSALDISDGRFVFKVLIKSFVFEKALMQEHFNENYMESDKYPSSTFAGVVQDISEIDFTKDGEHKVTVKGELTIHNVTNQIEESGTLTIKGDEVHATSKFMVKVADYDIKIAKAVVENIAEEIEVTIDVKLNKM